MHINNIKLPRDLKYIEIDVMADLHNGDKACDYTEVLRRVKEAESNPNRYLILNGDLINNAVRNGISDIYAEELSPMEQLKRIEATFAPAKDKILSITTGNHENRSYKDDGLDVTYLAAQQLGLTHLYAMEGCLIFLSIGELARGLKETGGTNVRQIAYSIYHTHGSGGGKRVGGKANRVEDMAGIIDVDIYIHSHTHLPLIFKKNYFRVDTRNKSIQEVPKLFVNTAAVLEYGGYGQSMGFTPANKDNPIIILDGAKKVFKALL